MAHSTRQCKAKTRRGARCSAYAINGSAYCFTHDPKSAHKRAMRNRRGGQAHATRKVSGKAVQIEGAGDVLQLVNKTVLDTFELDNTAARSRALLAACDTAIRVLQIGELEERVQALERAIAEKPKVS